jgi:hypothetical protein
MNRFPCLLLAMVAPLLASAAQPPAGDLPKDAAKRILEYESDVAAILKQATAEIQARRDKLVEDLQALQDNYTKAGKLNEAIAIRDRIRTLKANESNKVYLAALEPFETRPGPWPLGKGRIGGDPGNPAKSLPITVNGEVYPKGLGLHGNSTPNPATAKFRFNKTATEFRTKVAFDDGNQGRRADPTYFEVYGDGKLLWKSKEINTWKQLDECAIDVSGVDVLELRVGVAGNHNHAHGVWIDPIVIGPDVAAILKAAAKK